MADFGMDTDFLGEENLSMAVDSDPKQSAEASRGGRGRGGKGRGRGPKAKAQAKAGGGGKRQPVTMCICPGCIFPKYAGSRFCAEGDHKKGWDNMLYQRRTRKDLSEEDRTAFDEAMKSDDVAGKAVLDFSRDNPPELKRKALVDFAQFRRIVGHRLSAKDEAGDVPMTERAFYRHCDNVLGLEPEEAKEQLGCTQGLCS